MKAHIAAKVPERALSYAVEPAMQPLLSAVLKALSIEEYSVSPDELGQKVGYLAGFPGFSETEEHPAAPSCGGVLCMCGMSSARMDELLKALRTNGVSVPIKAMATAMNQSWSFAELVTELIKEHEAILAQRRRG